MLNRIVQLFIFGATLLLLPILHAETVSGVGAILSSAAMSESGYNTAEISIRDGQPETLPNGHRITPMAVNVCFASTFQYASLEPKNRAEIPGAVRRVSLWIRSPLDGSFPVKILFEGEGGVKKNNEGKDFTFYISGQQITDAWKEFSFEIPSDWPAGLAVRQLVFSNYDEQGHPSEAPFYFSDLYATSDVHLGASGLLSMNLSPAQPSGIFTAFYTEFSTRILNWSTEAAPCQLNWRISDYTGKALVQDHATLSLKDSVSHPIQFVAPGYGLYLLETSTVVGEQNLRTQLPFAVIPKPLKLSPEEIDESPYGINIMVARKTMLDAFLEAGIHWFRDYSFSYGWFQQSRDEQGGYSKWPNMHGLLAEYQQRPESRLLAAFCKSIQPPEEGKPYGPDAEWRANVARILGSFPEIRHWEMDNEYDLITHGNFELEEAINWENYKRFHEVTGKMIDVVSDGDIQFVNNGDAGLFPERTEAFIESGALDKVDVLSFHHYTGIDPPEVNLLNRNTAGDESGTTALFLDQLRALVRLAEKSGKQTYLSEFGWDTRAGYVVSPEQQAWYFQRCFMLLKAAGVTKGFWFYDIDNDKANNFFDGCGLFTWQLEPKLVYCSTAAITHLLPNPEYVGMIHAGEGTWGYVFRQGDDLVASLFLIHGDSSAKKVSFDTERVYGFLANPVSASNITLSEAPVYAVGISESSRWYQQTAYELVSNYVPTASLGDEITVSLKIKNNRKGTIKGNFSVDVPSAWIAPKTPLEFNVGVGEERVLQYEFTIPRTAELGLYSTNVVIREGDDVIKSIPMKVLLQSAIELSASGLSNQTGSCAVDITLKNKSRSSLEGALEYTAPVNWRIEFDEEGEVLQLASGEKATIRATVDWQVSDIGNTPAEITFISNNEVMQRTSLIPPAWKVAQAEGDLVKLPFDHWPSKSRIPDWMLGNSSGVGKAAIYLAWDREGLLIGMDVDESTAYADNPEAFWSLQDVLEVMLNSNMETGSQVWDEEDRHFWIMPQVKDKDVYVGRWKQSTQKTVTLGHDLEVAGVSSAKENGYRLVMRLPWSELPGFNPTSGQEIGALFRLKIADNTGGRVVYWPYNMDQYRADPSRWGKLILGE
ncbi:sugar-binding protein [Cerasicoccus frondis]|uniref:sugar-binding protein n=1 Tax=Cerasicoccus frondis TaxID=490090 RepID=UPI002852C651|nr:sugar-binding protein [Cerasicoccus frondis]